MKRGMLQIYYGEGQGKTSAALGNAIRYASAGKTVCIVQFMKGQLSTSYLSRLEPEIKIFRFERSPEGFDTLTDEEKQEEKINIANGLNFAKKVLTTGECDLLVLDEVLGLVEEMCIRDREKDVQKKLSPYLIPYDELPEDVRQMDRDAIDNILPLFHEIGLRVYRVR